MRPLASKNPPAQFISARIVAKIPYYFNNLDVLDPVFLANQGIQSPQVFPQENSQLLLVPSF